ncbi:MAG: hypothetical protein F4X02_01660 [Chloroflexi bacterium]|nr:hypothetical protein [Chloroflexota bacterium]
MVGEAIDDVVIVSKTTSGHGIFVGGLNLRTFESIQLGPSHVGYAHPKDLNMNIGEVWRLQLGRYSQMDLVPPHTENWNMISKESTDITIEAGDLRDLILANLRPPIVQPNALFEGQVGFYENGKTYVDANDNDLSFSVGFWRFNIPLYLDYDNNKNEDGNYYHSESGDFRVKYTGIAAPELKLPAGTVLRLFLSQSYEFDGKEVFWLVLSGWFL